MQILPSSLHTPIQLLMYVLYLYLTLVTVNSVEAYWAVLKKRVLPRFTRLQILEKADRSLFMAIVEDEA